MLWPQELQIVYSSVKGEKRVIHFLGRNSRDSRLRTANMSSNPQNKISYHRTRHSYLTPIYAPAPLGPLQFCFDETCVL